MNYKITAGLKYCNHWRSSSFGSDTVYRGGGNPIWWRRVIIFQRRKMTETHSKHRYEHFDIGTHGSLGSVPSVTSPYRFPVSGSSLFGWNNIQFLVKFAESLCLIVALNSSGGGRGETEEGDRGGRPRRENEGMRVVKEKGVKNLLLRRLSSSQIPKLSGFFILHFVFFPFLFFFYTYIYIYIYILCLRA